MISEAAVSLHHARAELLFQRQWISRVLPLRPIILPSPSSSSSPTSFSSATHSSPLAPRSSQHRQLSYAVCSRFSLLHIRCTHYGSYFVRRSTFSQGQIIRLTLHNALLTIPSTLQFTLLSLALLHPCYPAPPVNLFVLLDLPLTAPVSAIRVALLEKQRPAFAVGFQNRVPEDVETLLSRLSSFDARVIYIKYVSCSIQILIHPHTTWRALSSIKYLLIYRSDTGHIHSLTALLACTIPTLPSSHSRPPYSRISALSSSPHSSPPAPRNAPHGARLCSSCLLRRFLPRCGGPWTEWLSFVRERLTDG